MPSEEALKIATENHCRFCSYNGDLKGTSCGDKCQRDINEQAESIDALVEEKVEQAHADGMRQGQSLFYMPKIKTELEVQSAAAERAAIREWVQANSSEFMALGSHKLLAFLDGREKP